MKNPVNIKISIIIPTFNESMVISDCLKSLWQQSVHDFEVIVVDDGSNDSTLQVVSNLRAKGGNLKFMTQDHKGPGSARNLGASSAFGNILVFVDADMTFDKDFLKNLIKPIENGVAKGVFSKDEYVSNWDNVWSRCWNINENWAERRRHPIIFPDHQPVFRAILKSEFDRVGGFELGGYDDDWSLSKKLGYEAIRSPNAVFYHRNPDTLVEIFNHSKWVGKRNYKYGLLGILVGLVRASFPVSVIIGIYKTVTSRNLHFLVFKIVYDFGIFVGIVNLLTTGNYAK